MNEKSAYSRAVTLRRNTCIGGFMAMGAGALLLKMGISNENLPATLLGISAIGSGLISEVCTIVLDKSITDAETAMRGSSKPLI